MVPHASVGFMRSFVALLCSLLLAALLAGSAGAQQTPSFQAGSDDRSAYEQWFSGLSGEYRSGAEFWAGHRSIPREAHCGGSGDQLAGCLAAQQRLAPIDARRRSEPDYRLGWNSVRAPATALSSSYQPPALELLYHVQHNTYGCLKPQATLVLTNPLEPRRSDPGWVNYIVNDGTCAPITPNSPWRLVRHEGDLALMSYAGTTGRQGTFYLRESDLTTPVAIALPPPAQSAAGLSAGLPAATGALPFTAGGEHAPDASRPSPSQYSPPSRGYINPPNDTSTPQSAQRSDTPRSALIAAPSAPDQTTGSGAGIVLTIFAIIAAIIILVAVLKSRKERARLEAAAARRSKAIGIAFAEIAAKAHLLHVRREQLTQPDFYGTRDYAKWEKEKVTFIETRVIPLLNNTGMADLAHEIMPAINLEVEDAAGRPIAAATRETFSNPEVFSPDMDPIHYEMHCARQLQKAGWVTKATPTTGDQGADVLAERNGLTLVVQCKLYSSNVGNGAVQEAVAARVFHRTDLAVVVSNAAFTKSAKDLAGMSDITLLHHSQLPAYTGRSGPIALVNSGG